MVSNVIQYPTDIRTNRQYISIGMSLEENRFVTIPMSTTPLVTGSQKGLAQDGFATVPMPALSRTPAAQLALEEEWHTAFEQAISARAARVSQGLRRRATADLESPTPVTDLLPVAPAALSLRVRRYWRTHKRAILLCCMGIALFLLGFDIMGLLMLAR